MVVLPSAYLPPVSWFASVVRGELVFIEQHENYQKQTIRNRCTIDSPNGALHLSIPVDRSTFIGGKCPMKDVKISAHTDWRRQHWYAIETTYFNSPFFEYLQDDFRPFYEREWTFLIDFNEALIYKCVELLDIQPKISRTEEYKGISAFSPTLTSLPSSPSFPSLSSLPPSSPCSPLSSSPLCSPLPPCSSLSPSSPPLPPVKPYYQVFQHKHGFIPDLSIIDLIFNMGNESILALTN